MAYCFCAAQRELRVTPERWQACGNTALGFVVEAGREMGQHEGSKQGYIGDASHRGRCLRRTARGLGWNG
jgi:hypothetical protein